MANDSRRLVPKPGSFMIMLASEAAKDRYRAHRDGLICGEIGLHHETAARPTGFLFHHLRTGWRIGSYAGSWEDAMETLIELAAVPGWEKITSPETMVRDRVLYESLSAALRAIRKADPKFEYHDSKSQHGS